MGSKSKTPKMMLEIVTPYRHFFEGQIFSVKLPSLDVEVGVMPGHAPLVVALTPGAIFISDEDGRRAAVLTEGYAEVGQHMVLVVCNAAEWPEEVNVKRAFDAYNRAYDRYHSLKLNTEESIYSRHSMKRARERLKIVSEYGSDEQKNILYKLTGGEVAPSFDVPADSRL